MEALFKEDEDGRIKWQGKRLKAIRSTKQYTDLGF